MQREPRTFAEFWLFYLGEHDDARTRALHFAGTLGALACIGVYAVTGSAGWLIAAPILAYGLAWLGHFVVERNAPATFRFPVWSLLADLRMLRLWMTGRLQPELERARQTRAAPPATVDPSS